MAIMKLSNVPELTEFAGTEKIYVNDNGETKQIACDKVVTAGGEESGVKRTIINTANYSPSAEEWVAMIESGEDIWIIYNGYPCRIIGWDWSSTCGGGRYLKYTIASVTTLKQNTCVLIYDSDLIDRLNALGS